MYVIIYIYIIDTHKSTIYLYAQLLIKMVCAST